MTTDTFNQQLLTFLQKSPTPFHAVGQMKAALLTAGFSELYEDQTWQMNAGSGYFVTRNDASIIAFVYGQNPITETGIRMMGAHTDSPCLKVKPQPDIANKSYQQLGVEVYGGALLNPWFDRDLSIAGKVIFKNAKGELQRCLVDFEKPVATIPSLAIHLDREANSQRSINAQTDIVPILFQTKPNQKSDFKALLAEHFAEINGEVLDYDLFFYDTAKADVVGLHQEFIASARLDNLLSCFAGLKALLQADNKVTSLLVCSDHEEVGSASATGAQGPMLKQVLQRLIPDAEQLAIAMAKSLLVSTDNAHGVHPNFASKHDNNHGPILNKGPVIKVNANQRYATTSETSGLFKQLAQTAGVETQSFVNRTDMGCGSTIGPITSAEIGVPTLDVGVPTFAMHSIRELAGVNDAEALSRVLAEFCQYQNSLAIQ